MGIDRVVVVGGGLAGASAVAGLRTRGFDGSIVLVAAEDHIPYERPGLSKEYLRGEHDRASLAAKPDAFYEEQLIDVRLGLVATALHAREQRVALGDGSALRYDRLLLA